MRHAERESLLVLTLRATPPVKIQRLGVCRGKVCRGCQAG